jgi:hypothetical protein
VCFVHGCLPLATTCDGPTAVRWASRNAAVASQPGVAAVFEPIVVDPMSPAAAACCLQARRGTNAGASTLNGVAGTLATVSFATCLNAWEISQAPHGASCQRGGPITRLAYPCPCSRLAIALNAAKTHCRRAWSRCQDRSRYVASRRFYSLRCQQGEADFGGSRCVFMIGTARAWTWCLNGVQYSSI